MLCRRPPAVGPERIATATFAGPTCRRPNELIYANRVDETTLLRRMLEPKWLQSRFSILAYAFGRRTYVEPSEGDRADLFRMEFSDPLENPIVKPKTVG